MGTATVSTFTSWRLACIILNGLFHRGVGIRVLQGTWVTIPLNFQRSHSQRLKRLLGIGKSFNVTRKKEKMKIVQNESRPIPSLPYLPYEVRRLCLRQRRKLLFRDRINKMERVLLQGPRPVTTRFEADGSFWSTEGFYSMSVGEFPKKHLSWTLSDDGRLHFSIDFAKFHVYK